MAMARLSVPILPGKERDVSEHKRATTAAAPTETENQREGGVSGAMFGAPGCGMCGVCCLLCLTSRTWHVSCELLVVVVVGLLKLLIFIFIFEVRNSSMLYLI